LKIANFTWLKKGISQEKAGGIVSRGIIGLIGFILSPLSWWNDAVVNFPLAYAFAWVVGKFISPLMVVHTWMFLNLFIIGYFMTNLAGFLMLHYSVWGMKAADGKFSVKKQVFVSILYSLVIVAFFSYGLCDPKQGCKVLPSWVEP